MKICEIFYSIQGEGKWTGLPNIFIRTTGCNLRCSYCDTKYAYNSYKKLTIIDITNEIEKYNLKYVCITGGEPLLQQEIYNLIDILSKKGYKTSIETNGSIDIEGLINKKTLLISLDIKCPSSKMHNKMNFDNISKLRINDQIKFIIGNKKDYEYAKKIIKKYDINCQIFIQAVNGIKTKKLAEWILRDELNVRLGIQIHKIIWGNKRRF